QLAFDPPYVVAANLLLRVLHNAFPAPQWQPFIALQINTRDAAAQVWNVRSVLARLQIRRCVASGPHCWAMWIGLMRAELTKRLDVKPAGIRGGGDHRNTTPEYWIDGRRIRPL